MKTPSKIKLTEKFAFSLYNFKSYKDLINESLGKSILYVLIVSTVLSLFLDFKLINNVNSSTVTIKNIISSDFPDFHIKDGVFHVNSEKPFIYLDDNNTAYILENLETSDKTIDEYTNAFVFNKNEIICKVGTLLRLRMSMKDFPDMTKDDLYTLIDVHSSLTIIFIFFLTPVVSFIGKILSAVVILAPATYLLNKNLKTGLGYKKSLAIALYSLSLPMLIKTLLSVAGITFYGFSFVYYVLGFIYCNLAVNSIKESQNTNMNIFM